MSRLPLAQIGAPLCRPSPEECAEDYAWFRERLAEPVLLDCAVGVRVGNAVLLAVPTGGSRSGGYLSVDTMTDAVLVWAALRGQPGFPRVRLGLSARRNTCHTVNWGPRQPWDDTERGKYFGYAPSVIADFLRRKLVSDPPQQAMYVQAQASGRTWAQGPLLSTLRDIGGCLAVILMAVLVTVLVSVTRDTWPRIGASGGHAEVTSAPAGDTSIGWRRGSCDCREPFREPQAPPRALPTAGDTRWDADPAVTHTRSEAGSCTNENR
ncbi:DUF6302 family protein [Streptomyces sp. NPDC086080]|uniref:DUF6302 family protein n=1 Tax=Streptomyces sp. NPDC086080 TaxID=3365748 RepID=UPI0037D3A084